MSPPRTSIERWRPGDPLEASRLNKTLDAVDDVRELVRPARPATGSAEAQVTEDNPDGELPVTVWSWVSEEARTERVESEDDPSVYVDVEIKRSVTVRKPDGEFVRIQLENPSNG